MAFASQGGGGPMADINVTPLVDVMLVLLIIFMVTMPVESYPIKIDLPQKTDNPPDPPPNPPDPINLRIDAAGQVYWNDAVVALTDLQGRMVEVVEKDPTNQPQLQIQVSRNAEYEVLTRVLAASKNADMQKIGFMEPTE